MFIEILKGIGLVLLINPIFTYFLILVLIGWIWSKITRSRDEYHNCRHRESKF
jgi:Na+/proline symporter